jgi:hypothetical protein
MTLEEFIQRDNFGETLSNLDGVIYQWMQQKVTEIQAATPVDTGDLKRSIQLTASRFNFQIRMNYYGVFQNYGVMGTKSSRIPVNLPEAGLTIGNEAIDPNQRFGFKEESNAWGVKYTGIRARSFFSISDITNELENLIAENIINNL